MLEYPEIDLILKAKQGDKKAFCSLFKHHQRYIYNLLYQLTCNEADADDLTQETFIRVYEKIGGFRSEASLRTWMSRIAINIFRASKRKMPRHGDMRLGEIQIPSTSKDPERIVIKRELQWCIMHILQQHLIEEYREVVVLRDLQGFSYGEIGKILRIPVGTVKTRLHRARKVLQDHFVQNRCKAFVNEYFCICDGVEEL